MAILEGFTNKILLTNWHPVRLNQKSFYIFLKTFLARVGVIIDFSQKDLFQDLVTIILTSRMAISEMVDNDNDIDWPLIRAKYQHFT